jgi:hypothetical protein
MRISSEGQATYGGLRKKRNCLKLFENLEFKIFELNG